MLLKQPAAGGESRKRDSIFLFLFVIKKCKGFEPGRVSPLKKQCSTLFLGERAERTKRGQIAFAAGKDSKSALKSYRRARRRAKAPLVRS